MTMMPAMLLTIIASAAAQQPSTIYRYEADNGRDYICEVQVTESKFTIQLRFLPSCSSHRLPDIIIYSKSENTFKLTQGTDEYEIRRREEHFDLLKNRQIQAKLIPIPQS